MTAGRLLTELDVRTGERAEEAVIEQAKHLAQTGAALAQEAGPLRGSPEPGAVPVLHLHVDHRHFGSPG
jgi:hypothetical protein